MALQVNAQFNQFVRFAANMISLAGRMPLTNSRGAFQESLSNVKGMEMFFGFSMEEDGINGGAATTVELPSYTLEVSEDGKTATVKAESEGTLHFLLVETSDSKRSVAGFKWTQEFTFDLSDPNEAKLVGCHVGQNIEV